MDPAAFKRLLRNNTPDEITTLEPHVELRCEENNIKIDWVREHLLRNIPDMLVEDRPGIMKVYYYLSKNKQLKVVFDITKMTIRTVKIITIKNRLLHPRF